MLQPGYFFGLIGGLIWFNSERSKDLQYSMKCDEIKSRINDWETDQFLPRKDLQQCQQHDPILQVFKQIVHRQRWYSLQNKQTHRLYCFTW